MKNFKGSMASEEEQIHQFKKSSSSEVMEVKLLELLKFLVHIMFTTGSDH